MQAGETTYGGVGSEQRAFVEWAIALPFVKGNLGDACVTCAFLVVEAFRDRLPVLALVF